MDCAPLPRRTAATAILLLVLASGTQARHSIPKASAGLTRVSVKVTGATAHFDHPRGVATDSDGNVYVADTFNNTIRRVTPAGVVTTLAGTAGQAGKADGSGAAARFNRPYGVATDSTGLVYVADTYYSIVRVVTS